MQQLQLSVSGFRKKIFR